MIRRFSVSCLKGWSVHPVVGRGAAFHALRPAETLQSATAQKRIRPVAFIGHLLKTAPPAARTAAHPDPARRSSGDPATPAYCSRRRRMVSSCPSGFTPLKIATRRGAIGGNDIRQIEVFQRRRESSARRSPDAGVRSPPRRRKPACRPAPGSRCGCQTTPPAARESPPPPGRRRPAATVGIGARGQHRNRRRYVRRTHSGHGLADQQRGHGVFRNRRSCGRNSRGDRWAARFAEPPQIGREHQVALRRELLRFRGRRGFAAGVGQDHGRLSAGARSGTNSSAGIVMPGSLSISELLHTAVAPRFTSP